MKEKNKIEQNIPIPPMGSGRSKKHPIDLLKKGESMEYVGTSGVVQYYKRKFPNRSFTVRKTNSDPETHRVWRIK